MLPSANFYLVCTADEEWEFCRQSQGKGTEADSLTKTSEDVGKVPNPPAKFVKGVQSGHFKSKGQGTSPMLRSGKSSYQAPSDSSGTETVDWRECEG